MSLSLRSTILNRCRQECTKVYPLLGLIKARSPMNTSLFTHSRRSSGSVGGPSPGQIELHGEDAEESTQTARKNTRSSWSPTLFKMFESAATTFASILVLGLAGYGYHRVRRILLVREHKAVNSFPFELSHYSGLRLGEKTLTPRIL